MLKLPAFRSLLIQCILSNIGKRNILSYLYKHNILCYLGKRVKDASEEEEERYNDILIVMELLTTLLSKDFIDFSVQGKYSDRRKKSCFLVVCLRLYSHCSFYAK